MNDDMINPWECEHNIWQRIADEDYDEEDRPHAFTCQDCDCEIEVEYIEKNKGKMTEDLDGNHVFTQTFEKIITYYDSEE